MRNDLKLKDLLYKSSFVGTLITLKVCHFDVRNCCLRIRIYFYDVSSSCD